MALTAYENQTRRLLHDPSATYFSTSDIDAYINIARSQIAIESQSVRVLVSGAISSVGVTNGGASYAATTTVAIAGGTSGGIGAVATPTIAAGAITAVVVSGVGSYSSTSGSGYGNDTGVTATATDPTGAGSGAILTVTVVGTNMMAVGQEAYSFASRNAAAALQSGVSQIIGLNSVCASWGSMKPMLQRMTWTDFQAYCRAWTTGYQGQPGVWAQYGQGASGSIYLCPIPSVAYSMDWDTYCTPIALVDDTTAEAIPYPWTDAIPYYAAYLAFDNSQRKADSDRAFADYEKFMKRARAMAEPPFIPSVY